MSATRKTAEVAISTLLGAKLSHPIVITEWDDIHILELQFEGGKSIIIKAAQDGETAPYLSVAVQASARG